MCAFKTREVESIGPVVKRTEEVAEAAVQHATQSIDQLHSGADVKSLEVDALALSRSRDSTVSALGNASRMFLERGNMEDAELMIGVASALEQINKLGKKHQGQEWVKNFREFSATVAAQAKEGQGTEFTSDERYEMYGSLWNVGQHTKNVQRIKDLQRLSKRRNPFIKKSLPRIKALYEEARTLYLEGKVDEATTKEQQADRVLHALKFYDRTYNRKKAKIQDGSREVKEAIREMLAGGPNADKLFERGIKRYAVAQTCEQLSTALDTQYSELANVYGQDEELERTLAHIQSLLTARKLGKAEKQLTMWNSKVKTFVEEKRATQLKALEAELAATRKAVGQLTKHLRKYSSSYPREVQKILARLENLVSMVEELSALVASAKRKSPNEAEAKALEAKLKAFAKERTAVFSLVSTSMLLMNALEAEKVFDYALKASYVAPIRSRMATKSGEKVRRNLKDALYALIKEGPGSKTARSHFVAAIAHKARILTVLKLREGKSTAESIEAALSSYDPIVEFNFFQRASLAVYNRASKGRGFEPETWKLSEVLFTLESSIRQSEEKIFALGELELQAQIMQDSQAIIAHYTGKTKLAGASLRPLEQSVKRDATKLGGKISRANTINEVLKIAASFVHPAVLLTVALESVAREHRITGKISWAGAGMVVASTLAFRHAALFRGLGGMQKTVASKILGGTELALGGALMAHGGMQTYSLFKQGRFKEGAMQLAFFALPLAYGTVRTPLLRGARRTYNRMSGNKLLARMQQLERTGGVARPVRLLSSEAGMLILPIGRLRRMLKPRAPKEKGKIREVSVEVRNNARSTYMKLRKDPGKLSDLKPGELEKAAYALRKTDPKASRFLRNMARERYHQMLRAKNINPRQAPTLLLYEKAVRIISRFEKTLSEAMTFLDESFGPNSEVSAVMMRGRPKTPESLITKIAEKRAGGKLSYLLPEDIIGARAVFKTLSDAKKACKIIEGNPDYQILSREVYADIPGGKHGYRAYHFIVKNKRTGRKMEIQVATVRQRVWADWHHNTIYKRSAFTKDGRRIPDQAYVDGQKYAIDMSEWFHRQDSGVKPGPKPKCPDLVKEFFGEMSVDAWVAAKLK